ncbi:glutaminyl-peptide cyclotransferase [Gangjinia marincola]|uniref:Glutaminyl-peptide cyclotransferase n=1 Tax=Gangjinia marincola TaxID=578463 RepID=A0ABN1MGY7_9FLAO
MQLRTLLIFFFILLSFLSCGEKNLSKDVSIDILNPKNLNPTKEIQLRLKNKKEHIIDSVIYKLDTTILSRSTANETISASLAGAKLGKRTLSATVFSGEEKAEINAQVTVYAATPPKAYTFNIINTYPHDPTSFTQGLEFYNGELFESSGLYGKSVLKKITISDGKAIITTKIADTLFAEGLTIVDSTLHLLTWQKGIGLLFNPEDLQQTGSFTYNKSKEGWGLCSDGKVLYKSDGTSKIWLLDPVTGRERDYIETVTHKSISSKLNELEWVNGKIYANTWQKDGIAIIDPTTGAVEGLIDFRSLRKKTSATSQDYLNGIAYNTMNGHLYVTGKNWNKLFEVEIVKK